MIFYFTCSLPIRQFNCMMFEVSADTIDLLEKRKSPFVNSQLYLAVNSNILVFQVTLVSIWAQNIVLPGVQTGISGKRKKNAKKRRNATSENVNCRNRTRLNWSECDRWQYTKRNHCLVICKQSHVKCQPIKTIALKIITQFRNNLVCVYVLEQSNLTTKEKCTLLHASLHLSSHSGYVITTVSNLRSQCSSTARHKIQASMRTPWQQLWL